ncbi:MAG: hypothetical protein H8E66_25020 [Planctomycetes bacterium]|nr:hypothetical protein [Planctomycetota bacterium]
MRGAAGNGGPYRDFTCLALVLLLGFVCFLEDPDDLSNLEPMRVGGPYPAVEYELKVQWDAQREILHSRIVILRDIETHPKNVRYDAAGQLEVERLFAEAFLDLHRQGR